MRDEYETTQQFHARQAALHTQPFIGTIKLDSYLAFVQKDDISGLTSWKYQNISPKYDADTQILTVGVDLDLQDASSRYAGIYDDVGTDGGEYEGLTFDSHMYSGSYSLIIPMTVDRAKDLQYSIKQTTPCQRYSVVAI
jgi:hypothetical protein